MFSGDTCQKEIAYGCASTDLFFLQRQPILFLRSAAQLELWRVEILIVRLVPDTPVESSQAVRFPWKLREKYKLQHDVEAERRLSGSDTLVLLRFWNISFGISRAGKYFHWLTSFPVTD